LIVQQPQLLLDQIIDLRFVQDQPFLFSFS
jgi:hypothetical protein